jgi:HIRAN domain
MVTVVIFVVVLVVIYLMVRAAIGSQVETHRGANPHTHREGEKRHWLLPVVGESFKNDDCTSRQAIIARCRQGERIQFVREPSNRYDPNAIKVCRANGEQIGHVGKDDAARLADELDAGHTFLAEIAFINPAAGRKRHAGVVLRIAVAEDK